MRYIALRTLNHSKNFTIIINLSFPYAHIHICFMKAMVYYISFYTHQMPENDCYVSVVSFPGSRLRRITGSRFNRKRWKLMREMRGTHVEISLLLFIIVIVDKTFSNIRLLIAGQQNIIFWSDLYLSSHLF